MATLLTMQGRVARFRQVLVRLTEPLFSTNGDAIYRDSAIRRFEIAYEVYWKTLRAIMAHEGVKDENDPASPRAVYQQALTHRYLNSDMPWLAMIEDRNNLVHSYNEEYAIAVFRRLPDYYAAMDALCQLFERRYPKPS